MPNYVQVEEQKIHPAGNYNAICTDVVKKKSMFNEDMQYQFTFELIDNHVRGERIRGYTGTSLKETSKLGLWARALGAVLVKGQLFDIDSLKGKPCIIELGIGLKGKNKVLNLHPSMPTMAPTPQVAYATPTPQNYPPQPVVNTGVPPVPGVTPTTGTIVNSNESVPDRINKLGF